MKTRRHRQSFTLIEMLVVIVIIAILMGIVYRMSALVGEKSARARAVKDLELLKMCLESYYAAYGKYPPTGNRFVSGHTNDGGFYPTEWSKILYDDFGIHGRRNPKAKENENWNQYNPTLASELASVWKYNTTNQVWEPVYSFVRPASLEWREWFRQLDLYRSHVAVQTNTVPLGAPWGNIRFTNTVFRIRDPWYREYRYAAAGERRQSYSVWSAGPDGKSVREAWREAGGNGGTEAQRAAKDVILEELLAGGISPQEAASRGASEGGGFISAKFLELHAEYTRDDVGYAGWSE